MTDVEIKEITTESQVLIIKMLGIIEKQKGMKTWKYNVSDNRNNKFLMQTNIEPRELPVTFKVGRKYLIPIVMNKSGKVGKIDGQYMELIENYAEDEVITSTLPVEEQGGTEEQIDKITMNDIPQMIQDTAATIPKVKTANDKPKLPTAIGVEQTGSQLAVHVGELLPSEIEVLNYIKMYNFVKENVVNESDYQKISNKKFLKKSGFRKFIQAFKLSLEILEKKMTDGKLGIEYEVVARCTAPNGQFVDAVAICQQREKNGNRSKHDTLTTAMTRAKSRAISDLVAFGEVSAEEVQ